MRKRSSWAHVARLRDNGVWRVRAASQPGRLGERGRTGVGAGDACFRERRHVSRRTPQRGTSVGTSATSVAA
jgi:hypothetical protein